MRGVLSVPPSGGPPHLASGEESGTLDTKGISMNGISHEELAEVATHLAFYAGWPAGMSAVNILAEVGK
ncbi:hypothetical protein GCM10020260_26140 [Nesterenkonia halobia]|uniref:Carboxymuconolactone decarboxylase-like domain-containing protein n=1 Tax=Nesterenkonia halobia TaxID=37922 RepID=A0ABP6RHJ3_9MICC